MILIVTTSTITHNTTLLSHEHDRCRDIDLTNRLYYSIFSILIGITVTDCRLECGVNRAVDAHIFNIICSAGTYTNSVVPFAGRNVF